MSDLVERMRAREQTFWHRVARLWNAAFTGVLLIAAVAVSLDSSEQSRARGGFLLILLALAGWYRLLGPSVFRLGGRRRAVVYLTGLYAAALGAIALHPIGYVLLFAVFPHTWAMLERVRDAVAAQVVFLAGLVVVMSGLSGWNGGAVASAVTTAGVNWVFSMLVGLWIHHMSREIDRRADVINELHETRRELAELSHERGVLAERERLAREIHDTLAQGFVSILTLLQAAEAELDTDPDAAHRHLALARRGARENLAEARYLVAALTPALLDGGLPAALDRLVERFDRELPAAVRLDVAGEPAALPTSHDAVLLRTVQEALANVGRHAGASTVGVTLRYGGGEARVEVRDDGCGFDPGAATGFGLAGMRVRAEQVGGRFEVHSVPGSGSRVSVVVPRPAPPARVAPAGPRTACAQVPGAAGAGRGEP